MRDALSIFMRYTRPEFLLVCARFREIALRMNSFVASGLSPVIVALDFPEAAPALALADRLNPAMCRVKVGKELFVCAGPAVVEALQDKGFDVFLDLKFHDIPTTTGKAVAAAARLGVWMVSVHASGGRRMMEACREALERLQSDRLPWLIAVTVLTSMSDDDLFETGCQSGAEDRVYHLAALSVDSGMDGVVCSAQEAARLRQLYGMNIKLVTPGIRPENSGMNDQCRIVTPAQAVRNGSDYLVIGRPITRAAEPVNVLERIIASLNKVAGSSSGG